MKKMFLACLTFSFALIFFPKPASSSTGKKEFLVRLNAPDTFSSTDPRKALGPSEISVAWQTNEGLIRVTPTSTRELGLAESIEKSPDGLEYLFTLRNSYWSDGSLIVAADFERGWKEAVNPAFMASNIHFMHLIKNGEKIHAGLLDPSELGVKALDEKHLLVRLEKPAFHFLDVLALPIFAPIPEKREERPLPLASGPFFIEHFSLQDEVILQKNPFYWESADVDVDKVVISLISDEMTALQLFEQGSLDILGGCFTPLPIDAIPFYKNSPWFHKHDLGFTTFVSFNVTRFPFENVHLRKALSLAIDREKIVNNITQNGEYPAKTILPPLLRSNNDPLFSCYDPVLAKQELELALKELSLETLPPIVLSSPTLHWLSKISETLQRQWKEVLGIEVQLEKKEFKVFVDEVVRGNYDISLFYWLIMYNDSHAILDRFTYKNHFRNFPHWEDAEYLQILMSSLSADEKERRELFLKAEKILAENLPLTPIYHGNFSFLEKEHISGFYVSPIGSPHLRWIREKEKK